MFATFDGKGCNLFRLNLGHQFRDNEGLFRTRTFPSPSGKNRPSQLLLGRLARRCTSLNTLSVSGTMKVLPNHGLVLGLSSLVAGKGSSHDSIRRLVSCKSNALPITRKVNSRLRECAVQLQ